MSRRVQRAGVAPVLAAPLLAALAFAALGVPAHAASFKWANDGDVGAMDPYTRQETVQLSFLANIYEPLVRWDRNLKIEPALATSWKQTSPTVWRFNLRPGVKFQDGTPFTADDVVFSIGRIEAKTSNMRAPLGSVKEIRKVDDHTIDIETKRPDPILLQELTEFMIMSKAWCEAHNAVEPVRLDATKDENFAVRNANGTGPFKLIAREPDRRTIVEKNPAWWDKAPGNLDRVEFDVIGSAATRVAGLLSGELDMIYTVPPQDMNRIAHAPGLRLWETNELRTIFLGMDQARPELLKSDVKGKNPFKDLRVREAFALAIDENAIAKRIMRGQAHPTWEMWGPGINGYNAALDKRPAVDVVKAKKLLAAAGYPNGFGLTLDCPNDRYVNDEAICTAVVSMLARVGVKVTLNAQTKSKFFGEILAPTYHTSFYLLGWTPATYDAHNALYALVASHNGSRGEINSGGYSNPTIDALTAKIGEEIDPTKRAEEINEAIQIIQKDVAYIPLHQQVIVWAGKKNISLAQMPDDQFPYRYVTVNAK
ncbi:MAG: ABC transporter substrate-binding protein [Rhodospirillales bacterium]|nr:ABC transporter substrate-binding protein [Rhodospirillales bacterium]